MNQLATGTPIRPGRVLAMMISSLGWDTGPEYINAAADEVVLEGRRRALGCAPPSRFPGIP